MADRKVSVRIQAQVTDYMTKISAASKATGDFAHKVDSAKGKAAAGYQTIGRTAVVAGGAVVAGFGLAAKSAADFESRMALVRTLSHASSAEMEQLSSAALHVGQAYGFSANEVADAQAELVKAGISVKDVLGGALTGALTLAAAGQVDVAEATQIAATAMTQFGLSGRDVPHIADLLAAGADKALGSVTDLGYALDYAGLNARRYGISIEETVGTLAAFAQAGQVGERGGTVFAQMLAQLSAPSKQADTILKDLGIHAYDAGGQFVGLANLAGQLQQTMGGLTLAERNHDLQVIFGQRAVQGATILYQEGAKGIAQWTEAVNDQGFAALQAAGKLDSLSGDVTKLKTALQAAFIGVGEGAQGPLRTIVQDVTKAVEVWNDLPGPVKAASEAFVFVAGSLTLAGGAALLFIPKWTAMNAALAETRIGAISAGRAFGALGKLTVVGGVLFGVYEGAKALGGVLRGESSPSVNEFTRALADLSDQATTTQGDLLERVAVMARIPTMGGLRDNAFTPLDEALSGLVSGGHLDMARADFARISETLRGTGMTTGEITRLFPQFASALDDSATSARIAADGVDQFGNKVEGAGKKTKTATDRAKAYSDALHALGDPLFALNQSLQGVVDAQHEANKAVHKFGADSPQARQANLNLASAALDAEAAARSLAAGVRDGSVSLHDARKFLRDWTADGLITKTQADDVTNSFGFLIDKADRLSSLHPHLRVTADTSQADAALDGVIARINAAFTAFLNLGHSGMAGPVAGSHTSGPGSNPVYPAAPGGHTGGGGHHQPITYDPSDSAYYTPDRSGGSGSSKSKRDRERPPTVQEIVHAILTGTIPPSIDQLSKTLRTEIRHLTTTVGNAQQYRSTIRSNLLGYASLSNIPDQTDLFGDSMGKQHVNSYLKGRLSQLRQFVHLRHRLERLGAGEGLLHEFELIGPDANAEMRQLLQGGRHAVQRANRLEHRIRHISSDAAGEAASDRYGPKIVHELRQLPDAEAHAITKALRHARFDISWDKGDRHGGHAVMAS